MESCGVYQPPDDDSDGGQERPAVITLQEAQNALKVLIDFTESRDDISTAHLRGMERLQMDLEALAIASLRQGTLDRYFN